MIQMSHTPAVVLTATRWAGLGALGFLVVQGLTGHNEVLAMGVVAGLMGLRICAKAALAQGTVQRQKSPPPQLDPLS